MLVVLRDADGGRDLGGRRFERAEPPVVVVEAGDLEALRARADVERVIESPGASPLATRAVREADHVVDVGGARLGGEQIVVIAGPCSVESRAQVIEVAHDVARGGARALRGGAFKPRTSPYSFQGLGEAGLALLAEAGREAGLPVVTEVMDARDVELVARHAACLQVGARNMQNFALLKALGGAGKPVLLKRGFGCTTRELLASAEHILAAGNPDVILCERGIRTFEGSTRFTFDVSAIAWLRERSRLPVIADPSHAAGDAALVPALARSAIAAGADGLLVEVHAAPERARSDGDQALTPLEFTRMMSGLAPLARAVGRRLDAREELRRTS
jgi:3-deoxy-7-phosphoheptulonate synthase